MTPGDSGGRGRAPASVDRLEEMSDSRGTILYGERDVRVEDRPDPVINEPTDAIIRTVATCVCGSDLWPYRGIDQLAQPRACGHEYVGIVEEIGHPHPAGRRHPLCYA